MPHTVVFTKAPVTIWYEVYDGRFILVCREWASGNPQLGSALTCGYYDLTVPTEHTRLFGDLWRWIVSAYTGVP